MLYAAKCYWPGVTHADLDQLAARAQTESRSDADGVAYLGSLLFCADDIVLCLLDGPSRTAVKHASTRLRIPSERLIDSVWLGTPRPIEHGSKP
jgi:hypothetical protein